MDVPFVGYIGASPIHGLPTINGEFLSITTRLFHRISSGRIKEIEGDIYDRWEYTDRSFSQEDVQLLSPRVPNQIIGIAQTL
ncbi:DUF2437 domain-containing protein [Salicibibacter cibarius]|uniref:DUF2437 domain-containing protein n=1 Tax=Salicibibacter cibarius TaxID=2743000 RepID=UPI003CCCF843